MRSRRAFAPYDPSAERQATVAVVRLARADDLAGAATLTCLVMTGR